MKYLDKTSTYKTISKHLGRNPSEFVKDEGIEIRGGHGDRLYQYKDLGDMLKKVDNDHRNLWGGVKTIFAAMLIEFPDTHRFA